MKQRLLHHSLTMNSASLSNAMHTTHSDSAVAHESSPLLEVDSRLGCHHRKLK